MDTTTTNYLQDLLTGLYNTIKLGRDSLRVGNDGYHLLQAIRDYGDQAVTIALTQIVMEKEGISFIEASPKAAFYIHGVLQAAAGEGYGKAVRNKLN